MYLLIGLPLQDSSSGSMVEGEYSNKIKFPWEFKDKVDSLIQMGNQDPHHSVKLLNNKWWHDSNFHLSILSCFVIWEWYYLMRINPTPLLAPLHLSKRTTHYWIVQPGIIQAPYLLLIQTCLLSGSSHSTSDSSCHNHLQLPEGFRSI